MFFFLWLLWKATGAVYLANPAKLSPEHKVTAFYYTRDIIKNCHASLEILS